MEENNNNNIEKAENFLNENKEIIKQTQEITSPRRKSKWPLIVLAIIFVSLLGIFSYYYFLANNETNNTKFPIENEAGQKEQKEDEPKIEKDDYPIFPAANYKVDGNVMSLDLSFLKLNNEEKNIVFSPLSIKYALSMLVDAAEGDTKKEILDLLGDYQVRKYVNSNNMSFANAMFIRDTFAQDVKEEYINNLKNKYNADIIFDNFSNAKILNDWVSNKTYKLVNNLMDDTINALDFVLVNALAIDMQWKKDIAGYLGAYFENEDFSRTLRGIFGSGYNNLKFNNTQDVAAVEIGAVYNKYDIIKDVGEETIRKTVGDAWEEYYAEHPDEKSETKDDYLDEYIKKIDENYGKYYASTDFGFYVDDKLKVFSKELREYNDTTLQYVAIMPTKVSLNSYINTLTNNDINEILGKIQNLDYDNFEEGYITNITGYVPMFKNEYELPLLDNLMKLGISKAFAKDEANLSNLSEGAFITDARHKANIEFSNEGIKAAAVTSLGGLGAAKGGFYYDYPVKAKTIDLTLDKPYLYLIIDKKSGEVWFTGTIYEPCEFEKYQSEHFPEN